MAILTFLFKTSVRERTMPIKLGKQYKVKRFEELPDHWGPSMRKYQGCILTVIDIDLSLGHIFCRETEDYYWFESDLELVEKDWDD